MRCARKMPSTSPSRPPPTSESAKKPNIRETVEARDRQSASGHQDGDGETERDQDGHRGGHDDVDREEAQLSHEQQGRGGEHDQEPDGNDEDEGHRRLLSQNGTTGSDSQLVDYAA